MSENKYCRLLNVLIKSILVKIDEEKNKSINEIISYIKKVEGKDIAPEMIEIIESSDVYYNPANKSNFIIVVYKVKNPNIKNKFYFQLMGVEFTPEGINFGATEISTTPDVKSYKDIFEKFKEVKYVP